MVEITDPNRLFEEIGHNERPAMRAGSTSIFSPLSAPTAATKVPALTSP
jgi:hypothetical protein